MEALEVRSCRSRLRAMCRIIAKFSGALPFRSVAVPERCRSGALPFLTRLSSSRKDTSNTQWTEFPMLQWLRVARSSLAASESKLDIWIYIAPGFHRRPVSLPGLPPAAPPPPSRCCSAPAILFRNRGRTTAPNRQSSNNGESQFVRAPCRWSGRNHASYFQIRFSNPVLCPQENKSFTSSSSLPSAAFPGFPLPPERNWQNVIGRT